MDTSRSRPVLNRRGQALSEYAMLVAIVGMGLVIILGLFGRATKQAWQKSESQFAGEPSIAAADPYNPTPSTGGGAVSGGVQHTPPPPNPVPPKKDPNDSSGSAAADSLGGPLDNPGDVPQDPSPFAQR